ncbi:hypothetical protein PR048_032267 [Dryococelus australis]|uniref:Uncharacterized protein n=1 Tax=Dryococelus australis TaxID=614101 RepID=A0ABQ9G1Q7_9NEOP|nr:hypothetical protein PR048_032267 [Dryococelus australis]
MRDLFTDGCLFVTGRPRPRDAAAEATVNVARGFPRRSRLYRLRAVIGSPIPAPRSPDLNPLHFYLRGHLQALGHVIPVDDVGTLLNRIEAGCETIRNFPGIHQHIRVSMQRRGDACAVRGKVANFETLVTYSFEPYIILSSIAIDIPIGAVVAERLACSPPTKANRVSIPGRVTARFSHVGIVLNDAAGRRVFSGISRFHYPINSDAAQYSPQSPSSALKTSLSGAV